MNYYQILVLIKNVKNILTNINSNKNLNMIFSIFIVNNTIQKQTEPQKLTLLYFQNSLEINLMDILTNHILLDSIFKPLQNIIILSVFLVLVPVLLTVALLTLMERKMMATLQRRRGPNIIGFFGLLQPFADGLKLLTKEFNIPGRSYDTLVTTTPMISLLFTCSCFSLIPLSSSFLYYTTNSISALYVMAISSLNIYSIIMAGWSSKSAYAFLGSLRASAQFISYEVSLTLNIMGVFIISGSFNLVEIAYVQEQTLPNIIVIFPIFLLYLIGVLSETNRTPYDLAEAESELVAGYGVEFSAVGFAFFFIAEYASIILYCLLILNLFFAGFLNFIIIIFFEFVKSLYFNLILTFGPMELEHLVMPGFFFEVIDSSEKEIIKKVLFNKDLYLIKLSNESEQEDEIRKIEALFENVRTVADLNKEHDAILIKIMGLNYDYLMFCFKYLRMIQYERLSYNLLEDPYTEAIVAKDYIMRQEWQRLFSNFLVSKNPKVLYSQDPKIFYNKEIVIPNFFTILWDYLVFFGKILQSLSFSFGVFVFLNLFIHIRATYARYRFDQLMKLNWKNLLILSLILDLYISIILLISNF
jgi:NADH:ubiquinone oxidoreductase subunit H